MSGRTPVEILEQSRVVATVGISTSAAKESHRVPAALATIGFRIVPVHPSADEILGERAYPSLRDLPADLRVDIVQVFRPPAEIPDIARDAVAIGASALWMQIGLHSAEARTIAEAAGLDVIESQCMAMVSAANGIDHTV